MKRIGVFGGTFNPIHNGHVVMARRFIKFLKLDKLILIPVWSPPHKSSNGMIPAPLRLEMCRIAVSDIPEIEASDIEIKRGGISYTADTLRELSNMYPQAELFLITGADMFLTLENWKEFGYIVKTVRLCACARRNGQRPELLRYAGRLKRKYGAACFIADFPAVEISSTGARALLANPESARGFISDKVLDFIIQNGLYRKDNRANGSNSMPDENLNEKIDMFRDILKRKLSEKRFYHSCMVSKEAVMLAGKYGADVKKAEFAGLIHDIEKETPADIQLKTLKKYSIILDDVEKASPKLLHAISGAAVLRHEHNVADADVLNAVRYHTTARAGMSLLEKIIYLADYISADRTYAGVEQLRSTVRQSLEKGLDVCLKFSVEEQLNKNALIHPDTVMARNELILAGKSLTGGR